MNLRILKKLSKRAAPHMVALGFTSKQFSAERWEDYTGTTGHDRKHWDRHRVRNAMEPRRGDVIKEPRQGGGCIILSEQYIHPWPGTVMLGWNVGYETPEWEEDDAWHLLKCEVRGHWEECREVPGTEDESGCPEFEWVFHRRFRNPADILRALPEVIEARRRDEEKRKAEWNAATHMRMAAPAEAGAL